MKDSKARQEKVGKMVIRVVIAAICLAMLIYSIDYLHRGEKEVTEAELYDSKENIFDPTIRGCIVLNYHRISDDTQVYRFVAKTTENNSLKYFTVHTDIFREQMQYLKDNNIKVLSEKELHTHMKKNTVPERCATITFDDIDRSVYTLAYPILKEFNFPFSFYVVAGRTGEYYNGINMATWDDDREMVESGLGTAGLHTYDMHYIDEDTNLPPFLLKKNRKEFKEDVKKSIEEYEEELGFKPQSFAYPFGRGESATDKILQKQKIPMIYTLYHDVVTNETSMSVIPRFLVTNSNFGYVEQYFEESLPEHIHIDSKVAPYIGEKKSVLQVPKTTDEKKTSEDEKSSESEDTSEDTTDDTTEDSSSDGDVNTKTEPTSE